MHHLMRDLENHPPLRDQGERHSSARSRDQSIIF
jgi:hypothetical protein